MITIRQYCTDDAASVGRLIADTYSKFNLSFAPPEQRALFLGPFQHARSPDASHQAAIAQTISAAMVFVAQDGAEIVGMLNLCILLDALLASCAGCGC